MITQLLPAWAWLRTYRGPDLARDLSAGLTVAVMLVPQSMAYAMLAGLPPVVGLYASTVPLIVHALFTTSRHLSIGPVAIVSLLVSAACRSFAEPGSPEYVGTALLLALMTGVLQILFGIFRAGFLMSFVSRAVTTGFISAAALIICLSQFKHVLGIGLDDSDSAVQVVREMIGRIGQANGPTLLIGLLSVAGLAAGRRWIPRFPTALAIVVLATLLTAALRLDRTGVAIVGAVPGGLPAWSCPSLGADPLGRLGQLFPNALVLVFISYVEAIALAKMIAAREKYKIQADMELKALGLANVAAAFFSGYPVDGSFSRTAVNCQARAVSSLSSPVAAGVVILTLLCLTPLFHYVPKAVLGAIIIVAAAGLVEVHAVRHLFRVRPSDAVALLLTFAATLFWGVEKGVQAGVVFSLVVLVWRSARPNVVELGYVAAEDTWRDVARYPDAVTRPDTLIVRVDGALHFTNAEYVEEFVRKAVADRSALQQVILDFSGVNDMDAVAAQIVEELLDTWRSSGPTLRLAGLKGPIRDIAARAGWPERFGDRISAPTIRHAVGAARPRTEGSETATKRF